MADGDADGLIDVPALERFLAARLPGADAGAPLECERHVVGSSNVTYYVTRGARQWVLRRPPPGPLLPTAHDVLREHRYIAALQGKARAALHQRVPRLGIPANLGRPQGGIHRAQVLAVRQIPQAGQAVQGQTARHAPAQGFRIEAFQVHGQHTAHAHDGHQDRDRCCRHPRRHRGQQPHAHQPGPGPVGGGLAMQEQHAHGERDQERDMVHSHPHQGQDPVDGIQHAIVQEGRKRLQGRHGTQGARVVSRRLTVTA